MNSKKSILLVLLILLVFGILVVFVFDANCIFKSITGIPCPGCGLTRGFRALFHGHILKAEQYNILTIPIFVFLLIIGIIFIMDFIRKTNKTESLINATFIQYKLIVVVSITTWIVNNI